MPSGPTVTRDTVYLELFENQLSQQFCLNLDELVGSPASLAYCDKADNGKFVLAGINCFTYVPNPDFVGKDSACIVICDDTGLCDTTIVYINVVAPVVPPTRDTIYVSTDLNTPTAICLDLSELASAPTTLNLWRWSRAREGSRSVPMRLRYRSCAASSRELASPQCPGARVANRMKWIRRIERPLQQGRGQSVRCGMLGRFSSCHSMRLETVVRSRLRGNLIL